MSNYKKPIRRSIVMGCSLFIAFMCFVLSVQNYFLFSNSLYSRYNEKLENVLRFAESQIDEDDLYECFVSGHESRKFAELQATINEMVDDFGLTYIYVIAPIPDRAASFHIISSTSAEEIAAGDVDPLPIGYESPLSEAEQRCYHEAWESGGFSFYEYDSEWGAYYSAAKPLSTTDGAQYALLCADIAIDILHDTVRSYVVYNILLTVFIGALFVCLLIFWLRQKVTGPVERLEESARRFAQKSHGHKDPSLLVFDSPHIHTGNEVESLADAITQMTDDMKAYVEDILEAEERAEGMERLAFEDSMTHVKSKAAYQQKLRELDGEIAAGEACFAVLMVDLNELKHMNDTFGHDAGDKYLIGLCSLVADIYKRSPVYRIGGDEFVVIMEGRDYVRREARLEKLNDAIDKVRNNWKLEPWERYSAAAGMAVFDPAADKDAAAVVARADNEMYLRKMEMKKEKEEY